MPRSLGGRAPRANLHQKFGRLRLVPKSGLSAELLGQSNEHEVFRMAREAPSNVLKHAHATRVSAFLEASDTTVVLEIADDGIGFAPEFGGVRGFFGPAGMRDRVECLGGSLRFDSRTGNGTCVHADLPR
jgi:signal transduction histidine kinase